VNIWHDAWAQESRCQRCTCDQRDERNCGCFSVEIGQVTVKDCGRLHQRHFDVYSGSSSSDGSSSSSSSSSVIHPKDFHETKKKDWREKICKKLIGDTTIAWNFRRILSHHQNMTMFRELKCYENLCSLSSTSFCKSNLCNSPRRYLIQEDQTKAASLRRMFQSCLRQRSNTQFEFQWVNGKLNVSNGSLGHTRDTIYLEFCYIIFVSNLLFLQH